LLISDISLESGLVRSAHISSPDFYMLTRHSELWNQASMVDACGIILRKRFEQTGDMDEISNSISAYQRAVQLTPDGHADMPSRLNNFGNSLLYRFGCTGDLTDMTDAISAHRRAVQLTPNGDVNMPSRMNNLGNSFLRRFRRTGDLTDIDDAISAHERAVRLIPDGHADMSGLLTNVGSSFLQRFECTGDLTDIANAISAHQRAVQLTPDGHAEMPNRLSNLGGSFLRRFERTDDLTDITNAISVRQRAVQLTTDDHPNMPTLLNGLGISFSRRFQRTGDLTDIANAISSHQRAVQLTPSSHANMPSWLNNLGNSFSHHFERTGDLTDIASAISAHQRAVRLTPDGHVNMPIRLTNLGNSLSDRFGRTGDLTDIANAISVHQKALQLTPDGHANMPTSLNNLGLSFSRRFERTNDFSDLVAAISNYRQSATHRSGPPSVRLDAARCWAQLSVSTDSLEAYDVVVNLLSQIAGMDRTIQQRHSSLVDISRLTATASSAAFAQGEIEKALEWLEQGRCLVWNQLNQLRTPVDDLRIHNHHLADRFLHVSRALELSGSRQESVSLTLNGTMSQKVALEDEARTHIMLSQDWEQLLEEIRDILAFHNFLRPHTASNIMKLLPRDGPVILINVHEDRCDALALIPDCDQPLHILLDNFTHQYASVLRDQLRSYLLSHGRRMRAADLDLNRATRPAPEPNAKSGSATQKVLQELWRMVVKPILDALAYQVSPKSINK